MIGVPPRYLLLRCRQVRRASPSDRYDCDHVSPAYAGRDRPLHDRQHRSSCSPTISGPSGSGVYVVQVPDFRREALQSAFTVTLALSLVTARSLNLLAAPLSALLRRTRTRPPRVAFDARLPRCALREPDRRTAPARDGFPQACTHQLRRRADRASASPCRSASPASAPLATSGASSPRASCTDAPCRRGAARPSDLPAVIRRLRGASSPSERSPPGRQWSTWSSTCCRASPSARSSGSTRSASTAAPSTFASSPTAPSSRRCSRWCCRRWPRTRAPAATSATAWLRGLALISAVQWPTLLMLALLADPVVGLLLGAQWGEAAPLVRIMRPGDDGTGPGVHDLPGAGRYRPHP